MDKKDLARLNDTTSEKIDIRIRTLERKMGDIFVALQMIDTELKELKDRVNDYGRL